MADSSPGLISILRSALARLGDDATSPSDDPAVTRFKQRILRSIAQLELDRSSLRAPDVIIPDTDSSASPGQAVIAMPTPPAPIAPDSIIVLVARRPKPRDDDRGSGHSSAA